MQKKKQYQAPQLTVVTFKVERGYASSVIDLAADAANHFIEDRVAGAEMWSEIEFANVDQSIEDRTSGYNFDGDVSMSGWLANNGGSGYF